MPGVNAAQTKGSISSHFSKNSDTNFLPITNPPRKARDKALYAHFIITNLAGGYVSVACRHCEKFNKSKLKCFNPTKARTHIVNQCKGVSMDEKRRIMQGSQSAKRRGEVYALSQPPTSTVAEMRSKAKFGINKKRPLNDLAGSTIVDLCKSPSISSISGSSSTSNVTPFGSKRKHQPKCQSSINDERNFGQAMTQPEADKIILAEVKAIMHRAEPLGRLLDPYARAALMQRHPAIHDFLPRNEETIYNRYVLFIDTETTHELKSFIQKIPGRINIAMDGATVNGKQKVSTKLIFDVQIVYLIQLSTNLTWLLVSDCVHTIKGTVFNFPHLVRSWKQ